MLGAPGALASQSQCTDAVPGCEMIAPLPSTSLLTPAFSSAQWGGLLLSSLHYVSLEQGTPDAPVSEENCLS